MVHLETAVQPLSDLLLCSKYLARSRDLLTTALRLWISTDGSYDLLTGIICTLVKFHFL